MKDMLTISRPSAVLKAESEVPGTLRKFLKVLNATAGVRLRSSRASKSRVGAALPPKNLPQALGLGVRQGVNANTCDDPCRSTPDAGYSGGNRNLSTRGPLTSREANQATHSSPALPSPPVSSARRAGIRSRRAPRSVSSGGAAGPSGPWGKIKLGPQAPYVGP